MRRKSVEVQNTIRMPRRCQPTALGTGQESGFVLITMAISAIALTAIVGLSVDVGRMFIAKNETQAFCDSAALAGALALDGTIGGIANAKTAVANSTNDWNLDSKKITNPTVTFATTLAGPWVSNPNPATGYMYVRVAATVPLSLYFLPVVVPQTSQNVASTATAGQIAITSFPQGLAPYTAVSTNTDPKQNFGFVIGNSYDIQWPAMSGSVSCDPNDPVKIDKCFIKPPCPGDSFLSKQAVIKNWASSNSGYWGASSNNVIEKEIVDLNNQTQPVAVGDNIMPILTNGTKQSQSNYLDERANQDVNLTDNTPGIPNGSNQYPINTYFGDPRNGRRLLPVPIVDPTSTLSTTVSGFGQFLLISNGSPSDYYKKATNGNDPYCAIYAGPWDIGSISSGTGGSTGATRVKLVQ